MASQTQTYKYGTRGQLGLYDPFTMRYYAQLLGWEPARYDTRTTSGPIPPTERRPAGGTTPSYRLPTVGWGKRPDWLSERMGRRLFGLPLRGATGGASAGERPIPGYEYATIGKEKYMRRENAPLTAWSPTIRDAYLSQIRNVINKWGATASRSAGGLNPLLRRRLMDAEMQARLQMAAKEQQDLMRLLGIMGQTLGKPMTTQGAAEVEEPNYLGQTLGNVLGNVLTLGTGKVLGIF